MPHLLVNDDSDDVQHLIGKTFGPEFKISGVRTAGEAFERLESAPIDLFLLDVGLPDRDGFEVCSLVQGDPATRSIPVIFLTARTESYDKVHPFSLGACDYVQKPFDIRELRARVEARLRKTNAANQNLERGGIRIDLSRYRATLANEDGEKDLGLTPNEFKLFYQLISAGDRVQTRQRLREAVWGDTVVCDRTVDTFVSNLRKKLGSRAAFIQSVRGLGYRFEVKMTDGSAG